MLILFTVNPPSHIVTRSFQNALLIYLHPSTFHFPFIAHISSSITIAPHIQPFSVSCDRLFSDRQATTHFSSQAPWKYNIRPPAWDTPIYGACSIFRYGSLHTFSLDPPTLGRIYEPDGALFGQHSNAFVSAPLSTRFSGAGTRIQLLQYWLRVVESTSLRDGAERRYLLVFSV